MYTDILLVEAGACVTTGVGAVARASDCHINIMKKKKNHISLRFNSYKELVMTFNP